jgi:xanthine dehydrogenase accessory factor
MLALREDGVVIGSVSGGCVEDDLIARLHDGRIASDGPPVQLITYGVTREEAARWLALWRHAAPDRGAGR